ncbi:UPF0057-domain-containing protein [Acrodontium crateriforme]|uniref:UPF0057-domain-containing protein n=1 Tax=Acrodontium crateriforme TaxID=150365 RepID=A0AAQ3MBS9_9PEZI|nr:UPF0057-domain-containing protein [Acrodontium crateriforme]
MCGSDIFLGVIAILFPPIAVWVKRGICSADSLINIALCCLGFLPGLLHAWYIIAASPDPTYELVEDAEGGRVTTYYVQQSGRPQNGSAGGGQHGYGTVNSSAPGSQFPVPQGGNGFVQGGSSDAAPPSYSQAVKGDHKVQHP